ncbi:MAG: cyclic nucleotide-binding domain-containing protein [Campylobacterota bacterium]|nr:cyclic nucleotide-binding domain-containing protein [Campylobacterota bacterium]
MKKIIDMQEDLLLVFCDSKPILANNAFLVFFNVTSMDDFNSSFKKFVDCFVEHPLYFNKTKIPCAKSWIEAILELQENERIVSMITPNFEPHAFFVEVSTEIEKYVIIKFKDITQILIKRIMIDNANIPLFDNLEFDDITDIVKLLHLKSFNKDEIIMKEGSLGSSMYFIVDGSVLVHNKNVHVRLQEGDFFGEIALLKSIPRIATVKAISNCKVLELTTHDFHSFLKTKPELLKEIEQVASNRQNDSN